MAPWPAPRRRRRPPRASRSPAESRPSGHGPWKPPPALRGFEGRRRVPHQPALYYSLPLINTVPGATAIQEVIENTEWVSQAGNPVAYAPHIRKSPLDGMQARPVIIQFAKGDKTVPNPTASALIRAGDLADRASYFRNDLFISALALDQRIGPRSHRHVGGARRAQEPAHVPDKSPVCARRDRRPARSVSSLRQTGRSSWIPTVLHRSSKFAIPLKGPRVLEEAWERHRAVACSNVAADPSSRDWPVTDIEGAGSGQASSERNGPEGHLLPRVRRSGAHDSWRPPLPGLPMQRAG